MKINFLPNILDPGTYTVIDVRDYFDYVRSAKFEAQIRAFRAVINESKDVITKIKNKIPAVTISGTFAGTVKNANLKEHSGLICIDFDHVENTASLKAQLEADKYTFAVLISASGNGLAAVVKIDPAKHSDSYFALKEYYFKNYGQLIDKSCNNVSRLRFISMDPDLFINPNSATFKEYLKKAKPPKQFSAVLTNTEFEELMDSILNKGIDLTGGEYDKYLHIGFALASEFGETGRNYFHTICRVNEKYDPDRCDKQYTHCMRGGGQSKIRIGTFYHFCKSAGIELKKRDSYQLEAIAKMAKKQNRTQESVVEIAKSVGLDPQAAKEMAVAVFTKDVDLNISGETSVGLCRTFLQSNYRLRYNVITGNIEDRNVVINGRYKILSDMELNTMYLKFTESTEENISKDFFNTYVFSEFVDFYNPFLEFFETHRSLPRSEDVIARLAACIETDTDNAEKFIRHWGCGIISSIYGIHSPLVLVLAGELQNTGKTEWFRRLLPDTLKAYYAESKLDGGKDDDILMCRKLLIVDDEFGGKSKAEARKLKDITSKQSYNIRPPYGRVSKEMMRLAVLGGTTNDLGLLSDPSGNRRILPINVLSIDHQAYNQIDKNELLMAFYDLYHCGFKWSFSTEDIATLNASTDKFQATNMEAELIMAHFEIPSSEFEAEELTNTMVKDWIELNSKQRIFNQNKLGAEMKNLGFKQQISRKNGIVCRVYFVKKRNTPVTPFAAVATRPVTPPQELF